LSIVSAVPKSFDKPSTLTVSVRTLCDFAARAGDLDLRFTPSPSAKEGIAGHQLVAHRRPAHYRREIPLSGVCHGLTVCGRADGFDEKLGQLEEIKTHRGDVERIKTNQRILHWAQLKVYGALLCNSEEQASLRLALVYLNLNSEEETVLTEEHSAADLWLFLETLVERYLDWAKSESKHRLKRDAHCSRLQFPHAEFRSGQRAVAEAVYRGAVSRRPVLINAPTGIGKSIATLFPMLKALPGEALDKVFFLTAKGSGKASAQTALLELGVCKGDDALRTLEITARDKACVNPDAACHGESCHLARGFYDRLPAARAAALDDAQWHPARVGALAAEHSICPYFLAQELSHWADVVIADYNYYFDQSAMLFAQTVRHEWRVGVLLDEAHNLVERGRAMYSAQLSGDELQALAHDASATVKRAASRLAACWRQAAIELDAGTGCETVLPGLPKKMRAALDLLAQLLNEEIGELGADMAPAALQRYFHVLQFTRLLETLGDHSVLYFAGQDSASPTLVLQNCVPAPFLGGRARIAHVVAYFSATLTPFHFYRDLLGLPDTTVEIEVNSPFSADQLQIHLAPHISTRYAARSDSVAPIVDVMREQFRQQPANYLAFFSSYAYLDTVFKMLQAAEPGLALWRQEPGMTDDARCAFLARFSSGSQGIGFAVLGGSFSEGIDLPGSRLFGAFVVTLGLPQINGANNILRDRLEMLFGAGFDYAYLYLGLRKVVQAAGRVIRAPSDRGVVHLIDQRFAERRVQALLPAWWPKPALVF
jgi:DNA excision repair protein ERCC-2